MNAVIAGHYNGEDKVIARIIPGNGYKSWFTQLGSDDISINYIQSNEITSNEVQTKTNSVFILTADYIS